jgi:hypothetical protein
MIDCDYFITMLKKCNPLFNLFWKIIGRMPIIFFDIRPHREQNIFNQEFTYDIILPLFYITLTLVARNCKLQLTHEHEGIKSVLEIDIVYVA